MNWFWMNFPLMALFFAAWTGIPLWLSLRRPDTGPPSLAEDLTIAALLELEPELVSAH
jgi:hypothetical protein